MRFAEDLRSRSRWAAGGLCSVFLAGIVRFILICTDVVLVSNGSGRSWCGGGGSLSKGASLAIRG